MLINKPNYIKRKHKRKKKLNVSLWSIGRVIGRSCRAELLC